MLRASWYYYDLIPNLQPCATAQIDQQNHSCVSALIFVNTVFMTLRATLVYAFTYNSMYP